ncbi:helix-turn-helix domain-containing protein [Streptomyces hygroscopicus]|uniref:helix-turn-helix domain-containing protein n=1 Tax=Streptomyces hygroscopicus TaxID=1912 RepID=UPI0036A72852
MMAKDPLEPDPATSGTSGTEGAGSWPHDPATRLPHHADESLGARIAFYRNLAGYTQREFAEHSHLSLGSIRKVERGERLPTHGFLATAARTLAVSVEELTGQPYRGQRRSDEKAHAPIAAIRTVARAFDLPPEWRTTPRPLADIAGDLDEATRHRAAARYTRLGLALPELLEELTAAVHLLEGDRKRQAAKMLASAYTWRTASPTASDMRTSLNSWVTGSAGQQPSRPIRCRSRSPSGHEPEVSKLPASTASGSGSWLTLAINSPKRQAHPRRRW